MTKTKGLLFTAGFVLATAFTFSCSSDKDDGGGDNNTPGGGGTFTDLRDGKTYKYVTIGDQIWMAENLNYGADGSACYDNKSANCEKYGRLYDRATAMNKYAEYQGICPNGWHLPSEAELMELADFVGAFTVSLKTTSGWYNDGNGTDKYGFSALPGGVGSINGSGSTSNPSSNSYTVDFHGIEKLASWWNSDEDGVSIPYNINDKSVRCGGSGSGGGDYYEYYEACYLRSVRCVKGELPVPVPSYGRDLEDSRDKQIYKTIIIGTQTWMAKNLNYRGLEPDTVGVCYDNDPANCEKYGRLYDWTTVMNQICPINWHVPTQEEWRTLDNFVGNSAKLRAASGWNTYEYGIGMPGTDEYGFAALPGGRGDDRGFDYIGYYGLWWDSSGDDEIMYYGESAGWGSGGDKKLSVRCVKD